jgi:hypothetical protein
MIARPEGVTPMSKTLLATIQNGRYIIEEPATDYPEGAQIRLVVDDGMDDEEREKLNNALTKAVAQADAGELISKEELYAQLGWKK